MRRRDFMSSAAAASLTCALAKPLQAFSSVQAKNGLGLQLWTVRNQLLEDQAATLKSVSDAGYRQVELMSVMDGQSITRQAKALGLEVRSAFINWESIATPENPNVPSIQEIIEQAAKLQLEYLVFGYIGKSSRDTADKLREIADRANRAAEKVKAAGMKMNYHNHAFEFEKLEGDRTGYDLLIDGFDANLIQFELDVFWAAIGGFDPLVLLNKLGSRVSQVHLKDLKAGTGIIFDESQVPAEAFQEVGDGILDFQAIIQAAEAQGVTQFHVEQDESPDPLASIRQSLAYVRGVW